jgi:hypothetical protein
MGVLSKEYSNNQSNDYEKCEGKGNGELEVFAGIHVVCIKIGWF